MTEWLDPDNLEDPENTTQNLLDELARESNEIAGQVEFWPVGVEVGNDRNRYVELDVEAELTAFHSRLRSIKSQAT